MNIYYIAGFSSILFIIIKILESKFILKNHELELKKNIKDSIIIFIIIILASYIIHNYIDISESITHQKVFLNNPDF